MRDSAYLLIASRVVRGGRLRVSLLAPFAVGAVFTALFVISTGFALSGEQSARRDLGRFDHELMSPLTSGAPAGRVISRVDGAMRSWGPDFALALYSADVVPDDLPQRFTTGPQRTIGYVEVADPSKAFPGRYDLQSGRWPAQPGEVAISRALRAALRGSEFGAFSGAVRLRIVGVFTDNFAQDGRAMIAGSGTWRALPASLDEQFHPEAHLAALWSTGPAPDQVVGLFHQVFPQHPARDELHVINRREVIAQHDTSVSDNIRLLFQYPLFALSALVAISAFRANRRWMTLYSDRALQIGLSRVKTGLALTAVFALPTALALLLGAISGGVVGQIVRIAVLPALLAQPVGALRFPWPLIGADLLLVGIAAAIAALTLVPSRRTRARWARVADAVPWSLGRRVVAVVAAVRGATQATQADLPLDAMGSTLVLVVLAAVLLAPDLMLLGARLLSLARPRPMIARRLLDSDRGAVGVAAVVVAAAIAIPTTMGCFVATDTRTTAAADLSAVPRHQVWLDAGSTRNVAPYLTAIGPVLERPSPVDIGWTQAFTDPSDNVGQPSTNIASIPDGTALIEVFGRSKSVESMAAVIDRGGIALWGGHVRPVYRQTGSAAPVALDVEIKAFVKQKLDYRVPFAGVMTEATAHELGFDTTPLQVVYPDVSDQQISAAAGAVRRAGLNLKIVTYHVVPPTTRPAPEWYFSLGGLLAVAGFLLIALMRSTGELLHERATQLLAIGFTLRWTTGVAFLQLGLAAVAGLVAAVAGSLVAIATLAGAREQHLALDVPVGFVALTVAAVLVLALAGILLTMSTVGRKVSDIE